jgi:Protein of unknown function (DUF3303)
MCQNLADTDGAFDTKIRRTTMKFMVHWTVHADKRHQVLAQFAQMPFDAYMQHQGEKITVFGRWHDFVKLQGWGLVETEDTEALQRWLLQWNSALDIEVAPVVDDAEAHAIANRFLATR